MADLEDMREPEDQRGGAGTDGHSDRPDRSGLTLDQIRTALAASYREPHGKPRIHRAEALLDAADQHPDRETQFWALAEAIESYQFGGEGFRSPVPFSRLLRLWDDGGSGFQRPDQAAHTVHWMFKWLTSDLMLIPEVPLATIEGFVEEMERRYRLAGYGLRPVHQERFHIADHLGAVDDAERHLERWRTADRDRMSNCPACEQLSFGEWRADQGDDDAALTQWAETLDGELSCAEEPARTLAASLVPLIRLGRLDEARGNHLRGYRLIRGKENLRTRFAEHVEFCARTGNEGRGLELVAEHRAWFDQPGGVHSQMSFHASVALLLRRVLELGAPDLPVPGPGGRDWPAHLLYEDLRADALAIAARFDARNGNDAVSHRIADRIARQPLVDALPLGVRSVLPGRSDRAGRAEDPHRSDRPRREAAPAEAPSQGADPEALAAEASRLFRLGHPDSAALWERAVGLAEARGVDLDPVTQAELCEQRALTAQDAEDLSTSMRHTERAIELYEAAGVAGRALALHSQLVLDQARLLEPPQRADPDRLAGIHTELRRLYDRGEALALDLLTVRFSQAFDARESLKAEGPEWDADVLRYEEAALALLQDAEELDVPSRLGSGHFMLSEVALHRDDPDTALAELLEAIERYEAAGRPWSTAHPRMALAQTYALLGRSAEAEAAAHAAMETAARWPRLEFAIGYARQLLANVTNAQGRFQDSARHALEAAAWADRNADPELASGSRYTLAYAYEQLDRPADAAAVLESAMPDIAEHLTEPTVVEARWILGRSLSRLGDHRGAAEHFLLAARVAEEFPHQSSHAQLAAAAGHALKSAGMLGEARQAFAKSVELLRGVDDPVNLAKTLRALAWTVFEEADADDEEEAAVRDGGVLPQDVEEDDSSAREEALDTALLYFADAEQLLEAAFEALEYPGREPEIAFEIAETQDQLARLHLNSDLAEKALPYAEKAASGFRTLLPARVLDYDFSEQMVAWLLDRFLTRDAAIARLEQAIVTCEAAGVEAVRCAAYLEQLRSG